MRRCLVLLAMVLSACVPAAVGGGGDGEPSSIPPTVPPSATVAVPTATPEPSPTPEPQRIVGVLLGADYDPQHPERNQKGVRTDVFVIVVIDLAPDAPPRISFVSVPRDMLAYVPCSPLGTNRVNAAWYLGGYDCVKQTVQYNYGLEVNGPIIFGALRDFISVVDRMGGVVITPTKYYSDFCGIMGTDTAAGVGYWKKWLAGVTYQMDGPTALCYVRGRMVADGDLDRNRRALDFFDAAIQQWPGQFLYEPSAAWSVFTDLLEQQIVQTDADLFDAFDVVTKVLPALPDAEIRFFRWTLGQQVAFGHHEVWGSTLDSTVQPEKWVPCIVDDGQTDGDIVDICTRLYPMTQPPVDQP